MAHMDDDDVFLRFVEERRELGFRGERPPQRRRPMNWPFVALVAVALGAGLVTMTSTRSDTEITAALPK